MRDQRVGVAQRSAIRCALEIEKPRVWHTAATGQLADKRGLANSPQPDQRHHRRATERGIEESQSSINEHCKLTI